MLTAPLTKILGGGLILAVIAAGLTTKLYLNKRDQLVAEKRARAASEALVVEQAKIMEEEKRFREHLEAVRTELNDEVLRLSKQKAKVVTEIREVIQDAECAAEPMPPGAVRLLQCAARGDCPGEALSNDPA